MFDLTVEQRPDGWYILGLPETDPCGPYDTRAEAESDRRGLERTEKYGHLPKYWTVDPQTVQK